MIYTENYEIDVLNFLCLTTNLFLCIDSMTDRKRETRKRGTRNIAEITENLNFQTKHRRDNLNAKNLNLMVLGVLWILSTFTCTINNEF